MFDGKLIFCALEVLRHSHHFPETSAIYNHRLVAYSEHFKTSKIELSTKIVEESSVLNIILNTALRTDIVPLSCVC